MKNRLRELRQESGLSMAQIAEKMGITQQMYYYLERGERRFNEDHLRVLSDLFGVSIDYILGRTPVRNMTVHDIRTIDDLKRYLGLDKKDMIRLLFYDGRVSDSDSDEIPLEAVESVLEAIEYARWKYINTAVRSNQSKKGEDKGGGGLQK